MTWSAATLGDIAERDGGLIQTGPFGSQLQQSDYVPDGIPVIMPKDITNGRVDSASVARVSQETADRLSRHQIRPRTILLPRRGEITKRAFIRDDQAGWLCGTGCLQIALKGKHVLPEFLYYYMEQQDVARWLEQHAVGTTMLNLSARIVTEFPLRYPTLAMQHRIADILSAYDDLIENNRRRMALLDEAPRQLYREWFVRLRFPGHEHTRITNRVPEGWERVPTPEAIEINPPTRLSDEAEHWSVQMADLPTDSMVIQQATKREGRSGSKFRNGDTLFARITPCLENGKTAFVDFLEDGEAARGRSGILTSPPHGRLQPRHSTAGWSSFPPPRWSNFAPPLTEVGEVCLPQLIGPDGLVLERVGGLDHTEGWTGDQVVCLEPPVARSF